MKQLKLKRTDGWGGKRRGAGRKNKTGTVNHMKREEVSGKVPLHITLRVRKGMPSLRGPRLSKAFQTALLKAKNKGLSALHYAIESNHVHIFAEAGSNKELRSGMASLGSTFGKAIIAHAKGKGRAFEGRYHLRVLKNPTQTKNALACGIL